jgi:DNA-directed RNA polymerase II subunit RPB2
MENSTVWKLLDKYFQDNPQSLVRHHTESYNDFFKNGIFQIFKEKNPLRIKTKFDEKTNEYRSQCIMYFGGKDGNKIYFGKPVIYDDDNSHYMFPNEARLRNMTYGMTIHYDIDIEYIDILDDGDEPTLVGPDELFGSGQYTTEGKFKNFKEEINDEADEEVKTDDKIEGGAPKRRGKRTTQDISTEETALIRELTEKSLVSSNKQVRTTTIEKVLLGRFPIMVQSDYCVLSGLPNNVRHTMGECRNDHGGYFIIRGKEKTVVSQEKFGDNMLYIKKSGDDKYLYSAEIRSVSENVSKPIRTLSVKMMAPTPSFTFKNIVVNIPNVRKAVPLFIVFRALGVISDKQIITSCLLDIEKYEHLVDLFIPSVHDAGGILTQRTALKYIASLTKGKTISHAQEILADYFLPHVGETNYIDKAYYLGYITHRLLSVYTGVDEPTDRDNFKYKRIELVGSLMYELFREYYTMQLRKIHLDFESKITFNKAMYEDNLQALIEQNYKNVFSDKMVEEGFRVAFNGNWGAHSHTKRIGVVQDLNRLSYNSALSHLRKTNLPLDSSAKLIGPRVLHSTQWGMFDPIDTPDGGNIGIHKHMAITAYITQGVSREPMIKWLREKAEMKLLEECTPLALSKSTKVIINGLWAGIVTTPNEIVEKIRLYRRNGLLPIYTSVSFQISQNTVFIYTDAGRICRPIFYRDPETNKMSFDRDSVKKHLDEGDYSWNDLVSGFNKKSIADFNPNDYKMYELSELYDNINGETAPSRIKRFLEEKAIIDYIDTNETENSLIAVNQEELESSTKDKHTHLEIHESLIFGTMANIINFPENNPASRNSFSCGQSKQACSMYHTNYQVRMDKTAVVLSSGQIPLVKSRYLDYINKEENPYGENTIVAIMCYTGYNVEDAILINEGALKRGLFQTTYYTTYETHEEISKGSEETTEKTFTNIESEIDIIGTKPGYDYSKLDKYGIVSENTELNDKTVLIGMTSRSSSQNGSISDMSKMPKKGQLGTVDKTFITDGDTGTRIAKVRVREIRIPNLGDKMASRAGQKGTVGLVIPESDMPFTRDGIRPDMIINPHAIPSRMTIGHLVECIVGKASSIYGGFTDCTAFNNKGSKIKVFGEMLSKVGYHSSGNELLYNGMTGEQIETEIFMGPNYYMRLKHMVKDKVNYRARGPNTQLTRQPVSGRANDGGLRIGEMERDVVISHGATEFLRESMMDRADKYHIAVCNTTGMMAVYNPSKNIFMSPMADGPLKFTGSLDGKEQHLEQISKFGRNFSVVNVPYSFKLLLQELQTMNVQMRLITDDNIEQLESMTYSNNINHLTFNTEFSPQEIVRQIRNNIRNTDVTKRENIMISPESPSTTPNESPVYRPDSPDYPPVYSPYYPPPRDMSDGPSTTEKSPEFAPGSPYQPLPGEMEDTFSDSLKREIYGTPTPGKSPEFAPGSPYQPLPGEMEDTFSDSLKREIYGTPTPEKPEFNELSKQAHEYTVGEQVHYRGDENPNRLWNVTNIGDRFLKIETNTPGLKDLDTVKLVTALDIYKPNGYESSMTPTTPRQTPSADSSMEGGGIKHDNIGIHQPPPISIKIINNGNDFSSDNDTQPNNVIQNSDPNSMDNDAVSFNPPIEREVIKPDIEPTNTNKSGKLDFDNLVVKKV